MDINSIKYTFDILFLNIKRSLGQVTEKQYKNRMGKYSSYMQYLQRKNKLDLINEGAAQTYLDFVDTIRDNTTHFTPLTDSPYVEQKGQAKALAYYLPQFHQISLNDQNFGLGFTEWTNVTTTPPLYKGHNQPHIPIDVGFYDLSRPDVMYRQVELAKIYGIYGFCFYYYWFSGRKLLEKPLENWLRHPDLDRHFCFFWANEPWTKIWSGQPDCIICPQNYAPGDENLFFQDALPYFEDPRYIKINGCPVLIIYRPWLMGQSRSLRFMEGLREQAQRNGFPNMYLLTPQPGKPIGSLSDWGFDGMSEFFPYGLSDVDYESSSDRFVAPDVFILFHQVKKYLEEKRYFYDSDYPVYKGAFTTWDNSPRRGSRGVSIYEGVTPELYQTWLEDICRHTQKTFPIDQRYIFINAWNEWAEGAHLEPDYRYGYTWLQATKNALERSAPLP